MLRCCVGGGSGKEDFFKSWLRHDTGESFAQCFCYSSGTLPTDFLGPCYSFQKHIVIMVTKVDLRSATGFEINSTNPAGVVGNNVGIF